MKAIETQFRNGDISFIDLKPTLEENKSSIAYPSQTECAKHKRKQSILTKDISKNYRSRGKSPNCVVSNVREAFRKKSYSSFSDEGDTHTQTTQNKSTHYS